MVSASFSVVLVKAFVLIVTGFGLFVLQCQQSRVNTSCSSIITVRALIVTQLMPWLTGWPRLSYVRIESRSVDIVIDPTSFHASAATTHRLCCCDLRQESTFHSQHTGFQAWILCLLYQSSSTAELEVSAAVFKSGNIFSFVDTVDTSLRKHNFAIDDFGLCAFSVL